MSKWVNMYWISLFCLFARFLGAVSSSQFTTEGRISDMEAKVPTLVEANSRFAFDLYHQLKQQKGNIFFSPYNISTAFAMVSVGARGKTMTEMDQVLYYSKDTISSLESLNQLLLTERNEMARDSSRLITANALWVQEDFPLVPEYQEIVQNNFKAVVRSVDFKKQPVNVVQMIDEWVAKNTNDKITHLLTTQDVSSQTRLVLTSAIYMKGSWVHAFDLKRTTREPFHLNEQYSKQVEMMHTSVNYPLLVEQSFTMLEMPYVSQSAGSRLSLIILLPKQVDGIYELEKDLTFENYTNWIGRLKMQKVNLSMPRFRIEDRIDLKEAMVELGMTDAFNARANFSGISSKPLYINTAIHQTFIEVDEKGTEAAAATAIGMNLTASFSEPYNFVANHPFLFLIVDKNTKTILFMGRFNRP